MHIFVYVFSSSWHRTGFDFADKKRLPESEIQAAVVFHMERASGIEPPSKAWEASILPMNYARVIADLNILPLSVCFCKCWAWFVCVNFLRELGQRHRHLTLVPVLFGGVLQHRGG